MNMPSYYSVITKKEQSHALLSVIQPKYLRKGDPHRRQSQKQPLSEGVCKFLLELTLAH